LHQGFESKVLLSFWDGRLVGAIATPCILIQSKEKISSCADRQEPQQFKYDKWREEHLEDAIKQLGNAPKLCMNYFQRYRDGLNRHDLTCLAQQAIESDTSEDYLRLFIGSMIWGYSEAGYGPKRTSSIISANKNFFKRKLRDASSQFRSDFGKQADDNAIATLYDSLAQVTHWGSAFFTKYMYFLGRGIDNQNCPLILDTKVASSLDGMPQVKIQDLARVQRRKDGRIEYVGRYREGYMKYLNQMRSWARELSCHPDDIECFLYESGKESKRCE